MRPVHVGCSGWNYDDWRGELYPPGVGKPRWLGCYAREFATVEVNSTFYRLASRNAAARWADETPDAFTFAAKASRYLTHVRRLREIATGIERYYERLEPLVDAGKLGPIVWQLPATFRRDDELLAAALDVLTSAPDEWARRIARWRRRAETFLYFNNDWEGFVVANARSLKRRLRPSGAD